MKIYFIVLLTTFSTLYPFIIAPEKPTDSNFPGGYISLSIQWEKDHNAIKFCSYQINTAISIGRSSFVGLTFGKRNYNNGKNYQFIDLQGNFFFLSGGGIGIVNENNNIYFKKKIFAGLGPFLYSKDWVNYKNESNKNSGPIFSLPILTIFGNSFHP